MITVRHSGTAKVLNFQEFLEFLEQFSSNTCVVVRAILWCYKHNAFAKLDEIHGYFPTELEWKALERVIVDSNLRQWISIMTGKCYTLRLYEESLLEITINSRGVSIKNPSPTKKLNKREVRAYIGSIRDCIIEMQMAEKQIHLITSGSPMDSESKFISNDIEIELSTPTSLPELPFQRPLKYKVADPMDIFMERWKVKSR